MNKYAYSRVYDIPFLLDYEKKKHYSSLILNIIKMTNCKEYLELGIENMDTIKYIEPYVDICVGVDVNIPKKNTNDISFFNMKTDKFFKINDESFDIIFIDADHRFKQVKKDFENSLKILNEFGIIIFHDTDPIDEKLLPDKFCSDSYKIIDYIQSKHPELNLITLPIHETGLTLVMRKNDRRVKKYL